MTKRLLVLVAVAAMAVSAAFGGSAATLPKLKDVFKKVTVAGRLGRRSRYFFRVWWKRSTLPQGWGW